MRHLTNWVGIDDHADKLTVALYIGNGKTVAREWEVANTETGVRQLIRSIKSLEGTVRCAYEAGPCGYELYRVLVSKGIECSVAAPSLTPRRPGERVKTDRRDAKKLAELHRAGMLTSIAVPDRRRESVRDLVRTRDDARVNVHATRQRLSKFLLRHGLRYREASAWSSRHWQWICSLVMPESYEQLVLQELVCAVEQRQTELRRLDELVMQAAGEPDYAPLVAQLCVLRGVNVLTAMTVLAELGDLRRFSSATQLMAAVGLVPSEYSSGSRLRRYAITKTGNAHVRHVLVQAAWQYQHPPYASARIRLRRNGQTAQLLDIAKRADHRLHRKYVRLTHRGKRSTVAAVAVARELAGFVWAIGQVMHATH